MARAQKADSPLDRLYQLPLSEFVSARNALAKESGTDSAEIRSLPKPSLPAWAVNQLYWRRRDVYDDLIAAALAHNPDLHAAQARLRASRAQLSQQRAAQLPKSSATVAAIRMREPDVSALGSLLPSNGSNQSAGSSSTVNSSAACV